VLNANGPNTHYRDICVVDIVDPDFPRIRSGRSREPLEKGFVYDREI
jgi:hypothetical protein